MDLQIVKLAQGPGEDRAQAVVHLHGKDLARTQAELLGQSADARSDLKDGGGFIHPRLLGDSFGHPGGSQKVLTLGLGKMKAVFTQKGLHLGYVA